GYWYRDETARVYRKSLKGAYLTVWKMLQPVKRWRIARMNRHARKQWKRLGMEQWQSPSVALSGVQHEPPIASDGRGRTLHGSGGSTLNYEANMAIGEIRTRWDGSILQVRMRGQTRREFIASQWSTVLRIAMFALFLGQALFSVILFRPALSQLAAIPHY